MPAKAFLRTPSPASLAPASPMLSSNLYGDSHHGHSRPTRRRQPPRPRRAVVRRLPRFLRPAFKPAAIRDFIAERLARDESAIFLALDADGEALGFVQLYPTFSSIDAHRAWLLSDLFTTPAARGRGVGTLLMNTARSFALSTGAKGLLLETATDNYGAQRLYESLGYVRDEGYYTYLLDLKQG